jgi:hypothetical protein
MPLSLKAFLFFSAIALVLWLVGRLLNRPNVQWWGIGLAIYTGLVALGWGLLYLLYQFSPQAANDETIRTGLFLLNIAATVWLCNWLRGKPSIWAPRVFAFSAVALSLFGLRYVIM